MRRNYSIDIDQKQARSVCKIKSNDAIVEYHKMINSGYPVLKVPAIFYVHFFNIKDVDKFIYDLQVSSYLYLAKDTNSYIDFIDWVIQNTTRRKVPNEKEFWHLKRVSKDHLTGSIQYMKDLGYQCAFLDIY